MKEKQRNCQFEDSSSFVCERVKGKEPLGGLGSIGDVTEESESRVSPNIRRPTRFDPKNENNEREQIHLCQIAREKDLAQRDAMVPKK